MSLPTTAARLPRGEERPAPKTIEELVIVVADGSGSMGEPALGASRTKAEEVQFHLVDAADGFLERLKTSKHRDSLFLATVTFDHRVDVADPRPLAQVEAGDLTFDLMRKHGGRTAIGAGLAAARDVARAFVRDPSATLPRVATILLLSDGKETAGTDPLGVAETIKQGQPRDLVRPPIVIATAAYGADADEATLRAVASERPDGSRFFKRVQNGAELREFFLESTASAV